MWTGEAVRMDVRYAHIKIQKLELANRHHDTNINYVKGRIEKCQLQLLKLNMFKERNEHEITFLKELQQAAQ